jgi:hypothetical protein
MVPLGPARAGTVRQATAVARLVAMAALRNKPPVDENLDLFIEAEQRKLFIGLYCLRVNELT